MNVGLSLYMLGNYSCFCCRQLTFFQDKLLDLHCLQELISGFILFLKSTQRYKLLKASLFFWTSNLFFGLELYGH